MRPLLTALVATVAMVSAAAQAEPFERTEEREPCAAHEPMRRPFFGDTHIHTARSQDASTQGTRTTPAQAYAFAQGAEMMIQPWDGEVGQRRVQLARPLDFTALSDHAEQLGEVHLCRTPGAPGHDSWVCRVYRGWPRAAFFLMNARYSYLSGRWGYCGDGGQDCLDAAGTVWKEIQDAAEGAYDRSAACRFTSFVAYEWTASGGTAGNLHRNVIFRNDAVPALPISVIETGNTASDLWQRLDMDCVQGTPGCDVLVIPHNSNLDDGLMFQSAVNVGEAIGPAEAAIRARWEPLVEIMQHKGDSECFPGGATTDEACGFEKLPFRNMSGSTSPMLASLSGADAPPDRGSFVRTALQEGLAIEAALGVNPFRFGIIASTDTHLGTPGLVSEADFPGHGGAGIPLAEGDVPPLVDIPSFGPGGLAVVWAEENARDALFAGMKRRETYGTSGTRPEVRFFGGPELAPGLCEAADSIEQAYATGVPMGGQLDGNDTRPRFWVSALRDPDPGAAPLQRIQIIKGWVDDAGDTHEVVHDAAGGDTGASVDLATCERRGSGHAQLCSDWQDPDWRAGERAFYYARVLENPSCRWTQHVCAAAAVDCTDTSTIGAGLEACCAEDHRPTQRERAWTSPIWVGP